MGRRLVVEADGGSRGNPGVAGYGAVVLDADGTVLAERAAPLGRASNNVAEYTGLIEGLRAAYAIDPGATVSVRMDSRLVVEQMSGRWKVKHEDMKRLALLARDEAARFRAAGGAVAYAWIPRAENTRADRLSNDGMDGRTVVRDLWRERATPEGERAEEAVDVVIDPAPTPEGDAGPTRVVLVRHGVTALTEQARLDGRGGVDPDLSAAGRRQAEAAGRAVAHLLGEDGPAVRLLTSGLARAVQTGAAVAAATGATPAVDDRWDEQGFGDWDGASLRELVAEAPEEVARFRSDPAYARPGGESHEDLVARVVPAWEELLAAGGTSVVVCHRKPIMVVLAHVLGLAPEAAWRLAAAPGSLTALEVLPSGEVSVAFTNRT